MQICFILKLLFKIGFPQPMPFSSNLKEEIIQKLIYKGKNPPAEKTCISKVKFASAILASIAKDLTPDSAELALAILNCLKVYLSHIRFPTLDKIILKIMNKGFCTEFIGFLKNFEDPEILAALCYVKLKHLSIVDERIFKIYHLLTGEIKNKVKTLFKDLIPENSEYKGTYSNIFDVEKASNVSGNQVISSITEINISTITTQKSLKTTAKKPTICNCFYTARHDHCTNCKSCLFVKSFVWGDLTNFEKNSKFKDLHAAIELINNSRLKSAKSILLTLLKKNDERLKNLIYNMLALIHAYFLEYHESIYYLNLQIENSFCYDMHFALNCKFLMEKFAEISSITPAVIMFSPDFDVKDKSLIKLYFENKFILRRLLGDSFNRILLFSEILCEIDMVNSFFCNLSKQMPEYTTLFLFYHKESMHIYDVNSKMHISKPWNNFRIAFESIMADNQATLAVSVITQDDKRNWWSSRIKLDQDLGKLIYEIKESFQIDLKSKIILILEDSISYFPFELVFDRPAIRILSKDIFTFVSQINIKSAFYLLDPGNNLISTRDCISNYFDGNNIVNGFLKGVVGRSLLDEELKSLTESELLLYFGHGSGKKYFEFGNSKPKVLFLFGCSSCKLISVKNFKSNGYCLRHFKKRRIVLGNLWDVTDKDLDKLTIAIINDLFAGVSIVESIHNNRKICKLKYLNSAALVIYGAFSEIVCDFLNQE